MGVVLPAWTSAAMGDGPCKGPARSAQAMDRTERQVSLCTLHGGVLALGHFSYDSAVKSSQCHFHCSQGAFHRGKVPIFRVSKMVCPRCFLQICDLTNSVSDGTVCPGAEVGCLTSRTLRDTTSYGTKGQSV